MNDDVSFHKYLIPLFFFIKKIICYSMGKIYFLAFIYSLLNDLNNFSVHILAKVIFNNDIATRIV